MRQRVRRARSTRQSERVGPTGEPSRHDLVLELQRTAGNAAVTAQLGGVGVQRLEEDDDEELFADDIAEAPELEPLIEDAPPETVGVEAGVTEEVGAGFGGGLTDDLGTSGGGVDLGGGSSTDDRSSALRMTIDGLVAGVPVRDVKLPRFAAGNRMELDITVDDGADSTKLQQALVDGTRFVRATVDGSFGVLALFDVGVISFSTAGAGTAVVTLNGKPP